MKEAKALGLAEGYGPSSQIGDQIAPKPIAPVKGPLNFSGSGTGPSTTTPTPGGSLFGGAPPLPRRGTPPLAFRKKASEFDELMKMAFFDEMFKIGMNLPPMHPRSGGTGAALSGALPKKPLPQAPSKTPISDSVAHPPSTQAASGMLPRFPGAKEAQAALFDELSKIAGMNAMMMPARPASAAMGRGIAQTQPMPQAAPMPTTVSRGRPVQQMPAQQSFAVPGQAGGRAPSGAPSRPGDMTAAPHREMGSAQRLHPYRPQVMQEADPFKTAAFARAMWKLAAAQAA